MYKLFMELLVCSKNAEDVENIRNLILSLGGSNRESLLRASELRLYQLGKNQNDSFLRFVASINSDECIRVGDVLSLRGDTTGLAVVTLRLMQLTKAR